MQLKLTFTVAGYALLAALIIVSVTAYLATNAVPVTAMGEATFAITPNDLKPPACAGLNLTAIVAGSGNVRAGSANTLILGSSGHDNLFGGPGDDCLVGGSGHDVCHGGGGNNAFDPSCETQLP